MGGSFFDHLVGTSARSNTVLNSSPLDGGASRWKVLFPHLCSVQSLRWDTTDAEVRVQPPPSRHHAENPKVPSLGLPGKFSVAVLCKRFWSLSL